MFIPNPIVQPVSVSTVAAIRMAITEFNQLTLPRSILNNESSFLHFSFPSTTERVFAFAMAPEFTQEKETLSKYLSESLHTSEHAELQTGLC